jgi:uncharacterized DUF497 family protein
MRIPQQFEWDENKRQINLEKHGIDFADIQPIFTNPIVQQEDKRYDYGESRIVLLGIVSETVLYIVYTWRGSICRIISARRANQRERRKYYQSISGKMGENERKN